MQMHGQVLRRAVPTSPLILFMIFSLVYAQNKSSDDLKESTLIAMSKKLITIKLVMPDKRIITAVQVEGDMIVTELENEFLGITPHLANTESSVILDFFHIPKDANGKAVANENVTSIGTMLLNDDMLQFSPIKAISNIQLIGIRDGKDKNPKPFRTSCCVTCGGQATCALCVEVACGSCCGGSYL